MSPVRPASKIIPAKKVVVIELVNVKSSTKLDYVTEKKQETGRVVAVGKGEKPVLMKRGDIIAFRKYGEDKLFLDGKQYMFVTFADILGRIK